MIPFKTLSTGLLAATLLAACGDTSEATVTTNTRTDFERPDDHAIGNADAPVTIVEYASVVCPACGNWHNTVFPELKEKYVDTGKVRFVFREFPTAPERLADTGFMIANCADDKEAGAFMDNLKLQFARQRDILDSYRRGIPNELMTQYEYIAGEGGLSTEEMEACLQDQSVRDDYLERVDSGRDMGVASTPTFIINGDIVKVFDIKSFDEALEPLLAESAG